MHGQPTFDWRRTAGYSALAAPALMWTNFLVLGISRHGYDLLTRPFSDLATRGSQNATFFDVGFFLVPGLLTIVIGLGLFNLRGHGSMWKAGSALVVGAGVFLVLTGVFQQDPTSPSAGILHGTVSQICFALAAVAPLLLFAGSRRLGAAAPPRRVWLVAAVAALVLEAFGLFVRPILHYPYGIFQRPFTLALTVFFVTTGAWLLRDRKLEGLSVRD